MQNVLITGGAGFIGSTIADRFLQEGHRVRIYDNMETGDAANVPEGAELVIGDVRDGDALAAVARGMDLVIHQAAMVSVPISVKDPGACFEINVEGTRNALKAAVAGGARRLVLASSAAVYGNLPQLPKHEGMAADLPSPYAYSKWLNEQDAAYFSRYAGLETVCTRYFNVFGPRQRPDSPYSGVISIAADRLGRGAPFTVFGTGEQTRDFVFVEDVAKAVYAAATAPGVTHEVLNVGTGQATSLIALLGAMGRALGAEPDLQFGPPRDGDVMHSLADVSRLEALTGFVPQTGLEDGLGRTIAWMKGTAGARA